MSNPESDVAATLARLRRLDTCTVSDALDRLRLSGVVTGIPQQSGEGRIAGVAITIKLDTGPAPAGLPRHLGTRAIDSAGPNNVIVVEQRTGIDAGCWGGLLSLGAQKRGIQGVVADGPVRDIEEAQRYSLPIFTQSLTAFTARGRVVERDFNVPVQIKSVLVRPGDYVLADRSAIVFIAAPSVAEVLAAAEEIAAREAAMAAAISSGTPMVEVMGGAYEHLLHRSK
jgi:4-hydroxy-4-methyl-2-oxoglutarate aldolase